MSIFSERMQKLRKERNISQKEMSEKLNIPRATIATWESRGSPPGTDAIQMIADTFKVSTDYLLGRTDIRDPIYTGEISEKIHKIIQEDLELADFWDKILARSELRMISKQIKDLNPPLIEKLSKIIPILAENSTVS